MADEMIVKELDQVVVRFSGDSGDGMQLAGNIFSNISATVGNDISTFPDYPADIRAPQGSLTGVSGFQVHIGAGKVFTPGDKCDVLVTRLSITFFVFALLREENIPIFHGRSGRWRRVLKGHVSTDQIAREISEYSSLSKGDTKNVIDNLVRVLTTHLQSSESVTLDGFGTFRMAMKTNGKGVGKRRQGIGYTSHNDRAFSALLHEES